MVFRTLCLEELKYKTYKEHQSVLYLVYCKPVLYYGVELKRYIVVPQSSAEVYDHGKDIAEFHRICEDFKNSMRQDTKMHRNYTVTTVAKVSIMHLYNGSRLKQHKVGGH